MLTLTMQDVVSHSDLAVRQLTNWLRSLTCSSQIRKSDSFVSEFVSYAREMADLRLSRKKTVNCPLKIGANSKRKLPLRNGDVLNGRWSEVRYHEQRQQRALRNSVVLFGITFCQLNKSKKMRVQAAEEEQRQAAHCHGDAQQYAGSHQSRLAAHFVFISSRLIHPIAKF
jgi:hypothetical protein